MTEDIYKKILMKELIPALGCTEPIAIALAAAKAKEVLGGMPDKVLISCSGNIVKNVKGVTVPNSGGMKGITAAAVLGICGGNPDRGLQVLEGITEDDRLEARRLLRDKDIRIVLVEDEENLYLAVRLENGDGSSMVEIKYDHTRFYSIEKDGKKLFECDAVNGASEDTDKSCLSLNSIIEYADNVDLIENWDLVQVLERQISYNSAIADEGLTRRYGAEVGKTIMESGDPKDPRTRSKARAAAGSDARMGGSSLPVVINSGSGNQGITVSIPVIEFARSMEVPMDKLYRALIVSNLMAIHQKKYIGKLSAFCGVVSASAAASSGVGYLLDYDYETISNIVTNTIATTGGMVCDGAKPSCASKIAMALDNMIMAINMSKEGRTFHQGEGLVGSDVEETVRNIGRMARLGMKNTDTEILNIMIEN